MYVFLRPKVKNWLSSFLELLSQGSASDVVHSNNKYKFRVAEVENTVLSTSLKELFEGSVLAFNMIDLEASGASLGVVFQCVGRGLGVLGELFIYLIL
jgi:hypothetical protein